jgi:membrane fusion protein, heavy metal efflux system
MSFRSFLLRTRFAPGLLLALLLASCATDAPAPEGDATEPTDAAASEVTLTPEQVKAIGLLTGPLQQRGLRTSLKANGRLALPPNRLAQASILIGGLVKSIPVEEGQHVEKGQVLATLENLEFLQVQQDYLETAANLQVLESDLKRQQDLNADHINANKTLERAQADLSSAKARAAALGAKLRLFGTEPTHLTPETITASFAMRSPITGEVKNIAITMGQFAEPNKPLFEVVDNSALHVDLNVFEQDVARVRKGQKVVFGHAGEPVGQHTATIFAINQAFENDQQAVLVHAHLDDNGEELLSGMYIEALILTDSAQAWSLPSEAVVSNGDDHYIFVEDEPNTFKQVAVRTGASELGYTEVILLSELPAGAKVAIKGAYYLLSELTKGSGEQDH